MPRSEHEHAIDDANRIVEVPKLGKSNGANVSLPMPNPYASTNLIYTGLGRQAIVSKLDRIRLRSVSL